MENNSSNYLINNGFSIIICCFNSEKVIAETLYAISKLDFDFNFLEIILVNNYSSDKTVAIAKKVWGQLNIPAPLHIIDEPTPGLSNARKAGIIHAKYSYVTFCDDDNFLQKDYLKIALEIFEKETKIGVLGGQGIAKTDGYFPEWFDNFKHAYACGSQYFKSANVTRITGNLYGAGLCFRKGLITQIFQTSNSILSDRKAELLSSGGDSELCFHAVLNGYDIYYEERMIFYHQIKKERLTLNYLHKLYEGFGQAHYHLYPLERSILENKRYKKMPFLYLLSLWKKDLRFMIQFLIKGPKYSGTVRGAWLWGLTSEYFKIKMNG